MVGCDVGDSALTQETQVGGAGGDSESGAQARAFASMGIQYASRPVGESGWESSGVKVEAVEHVAVEDGYRTRARLILHRMEG